MYCTCGKSDKLGFGAKRLDDGTFNYEFWVCANCQNPTRTVFEKMTNRLAPSTATAILSAVGDGEGRTIITWATTGAARVQTMTFNPYLKKVDMPEHSHGRDVLIELWSRLDGRIDQIRDAGAMADAHWKAEATCLAETLALLMSPFYSDKNAVLAESMERWKARQAGTVRESPGLAESIWNPSTRFDGTPYQEGRNGGAPGKPTPSVLDSAKQNFIKHQIDSGAFGPDELAKMFEVSVEVIRHNYDLVSES